MDEEIWLEFPERYLIWQISDGDNVNRLKRSNKTKTNEVDMKK